MQLDSLVDGLSKPSLTKSFFSHVFSSTDESTSELLNVIQYAVLGVVPVVTLNKGIQRFVPDADPSKSSIELILEIVVQMVIMMGGIVFIHRMITFVPTYSATKYDRFVLTNAVLAFLVILLSVQTKLGIKVNLLSDRAYVLWNGSSEGMHTASSSSSAASHHHITPRTSPAPYAHTPTATNDPQPASSGFTGF
jgi:hypothetical protein